MFLTIVPRNETLQSPVSIWRGSADEILHVVTGCGQMNTAMAGMPQPSFKDHSFFLKGKNNCAWIHSGICLFMMQGVTCCFGDLLPPANALGFISTKCLGLGLGVKIVLSPGLKLGIQLV